VQKRVRDNGGWWAHELLGGTNQPREATDEEIAWAKDVYEKLSRRYGELVFARVDGICDEREALRLLECELVIPRLLLPEGSAFDRYAEAIVRRLQR